MISRIIEHFLMRLRSYVHLVPTCLCVFRPCVTLFYTSLHVYKHLHFTCLRTYVPCLLSYVLTYLRTFFFYLSAFVFYVAPCLCALFLYIPTLKKFINVVRKSQLNFIPIKLINFFPYNNYLS